MKKAGSPQPGQINESLPERTDVSINQEHKPRTGELLYNIPEEFRRRTQWVVYKLVPGEKRDDKVPYIAGGVGKASTTDLMTWRSFEEAVQALRSSSGRYDGVGFVFSSGDPFAGVDLDHCRNPETGEIEEWAREIVETLGGYAEVSQSGTGVHIIVRGKAPNKKRGNVEAYSSERYFAMTGRAL
jgi:primase-polymerase (primpol)-like protein